MSKLQPIPLSTLRKVGVGLKRPEDVVVSAEGRVWASDEASAATEILPDGSLRRLGKLPVASANGINMDRQGRIVIANFEGGPLHRLDPATGVLETLLESIDGQRLTASNYPMVDRKGNIWCSHSTFASPWQMSLDGRKDGFIYRVRPDGRADKVTDGLQFANGLALDADQSHLYACETTGCDVLRYEIRDDDTLGPPTQYGPKLGIPFNPLEPATDLSKVGYTDGCGFDIEGNLWVTLVMANKVIAITPQGEVVTMIEDPAGALVVNPTNVTWGGADMCDLYIGSITSEYVLHARSPIPGMRMVHQEAR